MMIDLPPKIFRRSLMQCPGGCREAAGNVMFESILADVAKQALQPRNLDYTCAAEGFERIGGEGALAHIAADFPAQIVGGKARVTHGAGFDTADARSKGIRLADRTRDDLLEIHPDTFEEMFGQVTAVE